MGGINHFDRANLPSKQSIALLCEDILHLLFPGFFSEEAISTEELPDAAKEIIIKIARRMEREIAVSLRNDTTEHGTHKEKAVTITECFFQGIPDVRALLKTDVEAAYAGDPAARSLEEIVLAYPGLEAIAIQRSAHLLYGQEVPLIPRMMTEWAHSRTGIDIHPGARIGSHFFYRPWHGRRHR